MSGINGVAARTMPNAVVVAGLLRSRTVFGPPGFGETPNVDSKVTIYYVSLHKPMSYAQLHLKKNGSYNHKNQFRSIQIWCGNQFYKCSKFLKLNAGKNVLISGYASYALEANDRLPVTMTAAAMDLEN